MPTITLPRILQPATEHLTLAVDGTTVGEAIGHLLEAEPNLRVHLFDEDGELRPHVLCFVDGTSTRLRSKEVAIGRDTSIDFVQAVSGG